MDQPYQGFVDGMVRLMAEAAATPMPASDASPPPAGRGGAMLLSPHPDDEVITGGLPLRLLRQAGLGVTNVAVTFGSDPARRPARRAELEAACARIGFALTAPGGTGLSGLTPDLASTDPALWRQATDSLLALLDQHAPEILFLPHEADNNRTHVAVHRLAMAALARCACSCLVVETEFWGAMATPNLLVESSPSDVADLVAALALHRGEVARNPYHLRLPAWMIDTVRRGAELVGGQGAAAPDFPFGTLYRVRACRDGVLLPAGARRMLPASADPRAMLASFA